MQELFNSRLARLKTAQPSPDAGKGTIELPGEGLNLRWQTRQAVPDEYENALADAVEAIYAEGGRTPLDFARALNRLGVRCVSASGWTAQSVELEMSRLGSPQ